MTVRRGPERGPLIAGALLILGGAAALAIRATSVDVGWPVWVIVPGIVLFLAAFALPVPAGSGLAVAGGIVTVVGCVLAVQEATDAWATWAYAWALVAPGGVGAGLLLYGILTARGDLVRGGLGTLATGLVLFLVGFVFFEGALHLSGDRFGDLTSVAAPAALVALGVVILVAAFVRPAFGWGSHPTSTYAPGSVAGGPAPAAGAPSWTAPAGWTAPGGQAGAPASGSATASAGSVDTVALDMGGATTAELRLSFGAGRLAIAAGTPGRLVEGSCQGGVIVDGVGPGRARLRPPASMARWEWNRAPFEWRLGVTPDVPLRLELEMGAANADLDLSGVQCSDLRVRTGAAETRVTLPAAAGVTRVEAEGGAASLRFRVPDGVAARIRSTVALGSIDVDTVRFPSVGGGAWESAGFDSAPNRVEIAIRGGLAGLSVR